MEVFIAPLIGLSLVVAIICLVIIVSSRKDHSSQVQRDRERQQRLQRNQERFYRQQSWLFWKNIFK